MISAGGSWRFLPCIQQHMLRHPTIIISEIRHEPEAIRTNDIFSARTRKKEGVVNRKQSISEALPLSPIVCGVRWFHRRIIFACHEAVVSWDFLNAYFLLRHQAYIVRRLKWTSHVHINNIMNSRLSFGGSRMFCFAQWTHAVCRRCSMGGWRLLLRCMYKMSSVSEPYLLMTVQL